MVLSSYASIVDALGHLNKHTAVNDQHVGSHAPGCNKQEIVSAFVDNRDMSNKSTDIFRLQHGGFAM